MLKNKHRAFLKWAGGKYSLVEQIQEKLPHGNKLIEPFVGAGSVFLNTNYPRYLLNDINPDLINLYNLLKAKPEQLISEIRHYFSATNNTAERYYELRNEFNACTDPELRAILFVYLNRHGYNGLCRYNLSGAFNVPFGRYAKPYFPEREMYFFAEKAQRAVFTCLPFERVFSRARKGNVIYCDPPYSPISRTASFTSYAQLAFTHEAQQKLAQLAQRAAYQRGIPVLVSNHNLPITRALYAKASLSELMVKRSISTNGENRVPVSELLAFYATQPTDTISVLK